VFDELLETAAKYREVTGRFLPIFGEFGELYAELRYGLKRNKAHAPGADGRIGNDHVEVKTISPIKKKHKVQLKRSGNFNKVIVVRISADYAFESRMFERNRLGKGKGKFARISWRRIIRAPRPRRPLVPNKPLQPIARRRAAAERPR
jgi:hypothetical protein